MTWGLTYFGQFSSKDRVWTCFVDTNRIGTKSNMSNCSVGLGVGGGRGHNHLFCLTHLIFNYGKKFCYLFICVYSIHSSQQFFSHVKTIFSTWVQPVNSASSESWTHDPLTSSLPLSHCNISKRFYNFDLKILTSLARWDNSVVTLFAEIKKNVM